MGSAKEDFTEESLVERNLENINDDLRVKKDDRLLYKSDTSSLSAHNQQYTELLRAYVFDFRENSNAKRKNKTSMFRIAKGLLIGIPAAIIMFLLLCLLCLALDKVTVIEILPEIVTALVTLLGTFMVIPQMITKYLFNKKEEENLALIIGKIQEYDRDIRGKL